MWYGGRADAPPHVPHPQDTDEQRAAEMARRNEWVLAATTYPELEEQRAVAERLKAERPDLAALSPAALVARARSVLPLERLMWLGEVGATNGAAIGPGVIGQLLGTEDPSLLIRQIGQAGHGHRGGARPARAGPAEVPPTLAERERQWLELFGLDLPVFLDGWAPLPPLSSLGRVAEAAAAAVQAGDVLQGAAAAAGVARGRARVVLGTDAIADFQPGEILIAPQTDPSWTALFMVSAAAAGDGGLVTRVQLWPWPARPGGSTRSSSAPGSGTTSTSPGCSC
jgi:hypothetical protein